VIGSALIASSLTIVIAPSPVEPTSPALITSGPRIELIRKQVDARFIGYVSGLDSEWEAVARLSAGIVDRKIRKKCILY
jgi:hypothetical protein